MNFQARTEVISLLGELLDGRLQSYIRVVLQMSCCEYSHINEGSVKHQNSILAINEGYITIGLEEISTTYVEWVM